MVIHCLGLNHTTCALELRERLAFNENQVNAALARLGCGHLHIGEFNEVVILSTCNRVEIYAVGPQVDFTALEDFLSDIHNVPHATFTNNLYRYTEAEAVSHLFEVAAGLDSLVVGEPQILGQVTRAFAHARSQNTVGLVLSHLFQAAIIAGKRARSETAIAHNPASIASVAARLALEAIGDLAEAQVVVLGAGEMAEGAVQTLRKRGVHHFTVVNRTLERAEKLSALWQGTALTFEALPEAIAGADILIASTGAPHTLIHPPMVRSALYARPHRPLYIIDIAVPRDVDEEVARIPGVTLVDMDGLQSYLDQSVETRRAEIPHVQAILQEEKQYFLAYLDTLDVIPLIAALRQKAENIRVAELNKTLSRMGTLTPRELEQLDALTSALVKKLLHDPTLHLRAAAGGPQAAEVASVARALFALDGKVTFDLNVIKDFDPAEVENLPEF